MTIIIQPGDPRDPQTTALLQVSHAFLQDMFNPDDNHFLSIDDLCTPDIRFFVARDSNRVLGCAALATKTNYGEVKSMFVDPAARGKGAGALLLDQLDAEATRQGLPLLRLETGDTLHAAHRLYFQHGYVLCGPFGDYKANPSSVFMEKSIS